MVFRTFGEEGLRARIREHRRLAQLFASWLDADPLFERMAPVEMGVVCFRACPEGVDETHTDSLNESIVREINAGGDAYLTHTRLRGRIAMRLAIGNVLTAERHVMACWKAIRERALMAR